MSCRLMHSRGSSWAAWMNASPRVVTHALADAGLGAWIAILLTCTTVSSMWAQGVPRTDNSADHPADSSRQFADSHNTLVPLPAVFYQTETGFGYGVTVGYYFQMSPGIEEATHRQSSAMQLTALHTVKKQIITSIRAELFPGGGRYRASAEFGFTRFPTKFWGVGNDLPEQNEEDYTPDQLHLLLEIQKQIGPGWYAGVVGQVGYRTLRDIEAGGLLDASPIPGTEDGTAVGVGALLSRDTRSSTVYPRTGSYHQLRAEIYDGALGSSYDFGTVTLDLRAFMSLANSVVALRALGVASPGDPPFDIMPQLGGDVLLRGYFAGRFRDRNLVALEAEYRTLLWWRIGAAVFGGVGQVANAVDAMRFDGFHPAAGAGLRLLLSPEEGLNIRADFGYGFDVKSSGFYLGIGEVF
jgi:Omp85 superfamily domain